MREVTEILRNVVDCLSAVPGVSAVVLGGSRARGTHSPASDIDIGIYYDSAALDLAALNFAAQSVDDERRENLIAPPGGWGKWVNGGAWLALGGYPVDFILRDVARVEKAIQECRAGEVSPHYQVGHPHAFLNAMYMGELAVCHVLWDGTGKMTALKAIANQYPPKLKRALINRFSSEAKFSHMLAEKNTNKDDPYYVAAHIVRAVSALNQVLFAVNEEYCINEKRAVGMIEDFAIHPAGYKSKISEIFAIAGTDGFGACMRLKSLIDEVMALLAS